MGLFNIINIDKKCPKCGAEVEWQSKRLVVDGIYPIQNFCGEAYASCRKCQTWTDLLMIDGKIIDDKRRIRKLEKSFEKFMNRGQRNTVW